MSRNRRNKRKIKILNFDRFKFYIIASILILIIMFCVVINGYKRSQDKILLESQRLDLEKQSQQIFADINENIKQANQNISESDTIIKLSTVGDILCGQAMLEDAYNVETKTYDFSHMFNKISGYINKADIVMGTMETNFAKGEYDSENAPIEFAKAVKESGVNLVSISHNHSLDLGVQGLKDTKSTLKELRYDVFGDKLDSENAVYIKTVKDTNIAFLTYTYGVNKNSSKENLEYLNIYSEEQVKKDIEFAKENEADYICVLIHWGDAISDTVTNNQKEIANFLIDSGVDMILGAHPSVVQPMEVRKNTEGKNVFIAYSIGTYISTLVDDNAKIELVLNVELRKSGKDGEIYLNKVDYTPIYVLDNGISSENRFELIDMKSVASSYAKGNNENITRQTYDKLIKGLKKLDSLLAQ